MKRFGIIQKLTGVALAALVALGAAGCSNLDASETGNAQESSGGYGRVALTLPESTETTTYEFSNISLKYKASSATSYTSAGTWSSSSELAAATVSLPVGTYTFVLSATITIDDETDTYSGTASGTVEADKTTALSFTLKRTSAATADDDDEKVTKGTANDDGTYTIISWVAADYEFTTSTTSTSVSGTFGDVTVSNGKGKAGNAYIQLAKKEGALKFVAPVNTSKIVVNAKVGSSDATSCKMTVRDSNSTWSKEVSVSKTGDDGKQAYDDYTFEPAFVASKDDDGNELNYVTVLIENTDSSAQLNIKSITVYAPTEWTVSTSDTKTSTKTTSENAGTYETEDDVTVDTKVENTATYEGSLVVKEAAGWLNSAYVIFEDVGTTYTITCDGTKVDDELLRHYSTYKYYTNSYSDGQTTWTENSYSNVCRVDVLGLAAGSHTISITPAGKEATTVTATVLNHDRSGFAFTSDTTPGAYNKDGTLKSNAKVIYVTNDNFNTVTLEVNKNAKGDTITFTGVQEIVNNSGYCKYASFNDNAPLDIRIIGRIDSTTGFPSSSWGSSSEGLQVKGTGKVNTVFTIEGVGSDATLWGFGILCRTTRYIELSNLAIMCHKDDAISLDTDNQYTWVHNCDIFYGNAGSDSDQAKGDGSLDVKGDSKYQTFSYNHFWDSGKSSLCGLSESADNYMTYHHNWFDHSDSRHPRIRRMSVHIYNNYFDGNAKYGVGVTLGASAFVEQNIFRNPHDPMMSSKQGTDATGDGTFSGENGGIIKAYNNLMFQLNCNNVKFQYMTNKDDGWTSSDNDIDAYIVDNRSDTVPSTLTTVAGGTTYNNFDTTVNLGLANEPQAPADALNSVVKYCGRRNPGFAWTFNNATEDANYSVISALKSALVSYTNTGLTKVGQ